MLDIFSMYLLLSLTDNSGAYSLNETSTCDTAISLLHTHVQQLGGRGCVCNIIIRCHGYESTLYSKAMEANPYTFVARQRLWS